MLGCSCCKKADPFQPIEPFTKGDVRMLHYTYYEDGRIIGGRNLGQGDLEIIEDDFLISFDELRIVLDSGDTAKWFIHRYNKEGVPSRLVYFENTYNLVSSGVVDGRMNSLNYQSDTEKINIQFLRN